MPNPTRGFQLVSADGGCESSAATKAFVELGLEAGLLFSQILTASARARGLAKLVPLLKLPLYPETSYAKCGTCVFIAWPYCEGGPYEDFCQG
jgi:hypothetical protein